MTATKSGKRIKRPKLLSHTRPVPIKKSSSLSSQATRTLIRSHHTLQKQLGRAVAKNDTALATSLQAQLHDAGGLKKYQDASIQGQSAERGGDSSRVLMEWLKDLDTQQQTQAEDSRVTTKKGGEARLHMLEVGALKTDNTCSRSGLFDMERIDLYSRHPDILKQDFMQRPIPEEGEIGQKGFDVVSLSLVVNYVGDTAGRGEMLRRVSKFLRLSAGDYGIDGKGLLPALFLVLPAPCVENSRYLGEERLESIMRALGYVKVRRKMSQKLVYYLWRFDGAKGNVERKFRKEELRKGKERNNFAIILD